MARTRSVHWQPKQHGPDKEEAETLLDLHKQYIRLYYSCIAKRLGVDASYINRVANGEHQSEKLRRAFAVRTWPNASRGLGAGTLKTWLTSASATQTGVHLIITLS